MKIGIVGNGMIVRQMLQDIEKLPDFTVLSICVRKKSLEKGRALAEEFGVKNIDTNYEDFLKRTEINVIYIGIVNQMHFEYARRALEMGKHVICEKPITVTAGETKLLAELARKKGLFLWEAFKIPYSSVFQAVKSHLKEIGTVKLVQCNYSRISSRYRQYESGIVLSVFDPSCGGGCLYDINLYNLHFVTGLFGKPEKVHYYAKFNGVDTSGAVFLKYRDFLGVCSGAKDSSSPCFAIVQGTKGWIQVEGPASAAVRAELVVGGKHQILSEDSEPGTLSRELREFARQIRENDWGACQKMLNHSIMMMEVLEEAIGSDVMLG